MLLLCVYNLGYGNLWAAVDAVGCLTAPTASDSSGRAENYEGDFLNAFRFGFWGTLSCLQPLPALSTG